MHAVDDIALRIEQDGVAAVGVADAVDVLRVRRMGAFGPFPIEPVRIRAQHGFQDGAHAQVVAIAIAPAPRFDCLQEEGTHGALGKRDVFSGANQSVYVVHLAVDGGGMGVAGPAFERKSLFCLRSFHR